MNIVKFTKWRRSIEVIDGILINNRALRSLTKSLTTHSLQYMYDLLSECLLRIFLCPSNIIIFVKTFFERNK